MNPRTVLSLADGRNIDLVHPVATDYRPLNWAAEHLAKETRYNGATPLVSYSVAQHLFEGTFAILMATGDRMLASYFSLHDVHEAVLKDDTTPKKRALAAVAAEKFGVLASSVMDAFADLTERHDRAIHEAASLAWPMPPEIAREVEKYDRVMLLTEWRDLMRMPLPNADSYADFAPLDMTIRPRADWRRAADDLLNLWSDLFGPGLITRDF